MQFDAQVSFQLAAIVASPSFSNSELISEFFEQKLAITVLKRINFPEARDWNRVTMRMEEQTHSCLCVTQTIEMCKYAVEFGVVFEEKCLDTHIRGCIDR